MLKSFFYIYILYDIYIIFLFHGHAREYRPCKELSQCTAACYETAKQVVADQMPQKSQKRIRWVLVPVRSNTDRFPENTVAAALNNTVAAAFAAVVVAAAVAPNTAGGTKNTRSAVDVVAGTAPPPRKAAGLSRDTAAAVAVAVAVRKPSEKTAALSEFSNHVDSEPRPL